MTKFINNSRVATLDTLWLGGRVGGQKSKRDKGGWRRQVAWVQSVCNLCSHWSIACYSTINIKCRQPIESLLTQLDEKTSYKLARRNKRYISISIIIIIITKVTFWLIYLTSEHFYNYNFSITQIQCQVSIIADTRYTDHIFYNFYSFGVFKYRFGLSLLLDYRD